MLKEGCSDKQRSRIGRSAGPRLHRSYHRADDMPPKSRDAWAHDHAYHAAHSLGTLTHRPYRLRGSRRSRYQRVEDLEVEEEDENITMAESALAGSPTPMETTETPTQASDITQEQWRAMKDVIETIYTYREPE